MKRIYTCVRKDGIEVRMYKNERGYYEVVAGEKGSWMKPLLESDNYADAYRFYNDRLGRA